METVILQLASTVGGIAGLLAVLIYLGERKVMASQREAYERLVKEALESSATQLDQFGKLIRETISGYTTLCGQVEALRRVTDTHYQELVNHRFATESRVGELYNEMYWRRGGKNRLPGAPGPTPEPAPESGSEPEEHKERQ